MFPFAIQFFFWLLSPLTRTLDYVVSKLKKRPCWCSQVLFPLFQCVTSAGDPSSPSVWIPHPPSICQDKLWVDQGKQIPVPQTVLAPSSSPVLLLAATPKTTEELSCGRRWQWLMLIPLATELIWNSHLNTVYGSEEGIRDQMSYGCPYHQVFLSSGFREVDAALGAAVVCNLVYC